MYVLYIKYLTYLGSVKSPRGKEELFYFALQFVAMDSYIWDR